MKNIPSIRILLLFALPTLAMAQKQDALDTLILSKIKDESLNRSQVMNILSMITDVYGPRLTNSPGYKKAAAYAKSTLNPGAFRMCNMITGRRTLAVGGN